MKIVSIVPVRGRELLLDLTIGRLTKQVDKVICGGHTESECEVCEKHGADFYRFGNTSLGYKWQYCVDRAREYSPDAILIMGSASMISDNWIDELYPELEEFAMVGRPGIHYYHIGTTRNRLMYWSGYPGGRSLEPIGVGRLISSEFLDKIDWQIFDKQINSSLDYSTVQRIKWGGGEIGISENEKVESIRISTDLWKNKNGYSKMAKHHHSTEIQEFDILDKFPELINYESILYKS